MGRVIHSGSGAGGGGAAGTFSPSSTFRPAPGTDIEIFSVVFTNDDAAAKLSNMALSVDEQATWTLLVSLLSLDPAESWIWGTGGGRIMVLSHSDILGFDPGENVDFTVFGNEIL